MQSNHALSFSALCREPQKVLTLNIPPLLLYLFEPSSCPNSWYPLRTVHSSGTPKLHEMRVNRGLQVPLSIWSTTILLE